MALSNKKHTYKSIDELVKQFQQCTENNNILVLNCLPGRAGKLRQKDIEILKELSKRMM